jgi:hypothetical protein
MFMCITRLVLRTKKERRQKQDAQGTDTVNLKSGRKQSKRSKCC